MPTHAGDETLGGWFIVEVADRTKALELARSLPTPETVEVRPILESA
ncbi:YciI family protein [Streptomyces puniciscabiei]|nr:YciI family protein [Streptomyces puniciscabiei]